MEDHTVNHSMNHSMNHPMDYHERHALFRSHACAVFRGDTAETVRIQRLIWPDHLLAHQVFAFALFATCVNDHFGDDLDWAVLDILIERVRRTAPGVSLLKTEALIRVCYDDPHLFMEVPQSEHAASIWAVCRLIVGGERTETELDGLFARADDFGRDLVRSVFASAHLYGWRDDIETEDAAAEDTAARTEARDAAVRTEAVEAEGRTDAVHAQSGAERGDAGEEAP